MTSSFERRLVILWIVLLASMMGGELLPSDSAQIVLLSAADMSDKLLHSIGVASGGMVGRGTRNHQILLV